MGGAWSVAIFALLCLGVVFSMKTSNYLQHYGLRRIRLPSGKFERVQPWHAWSAARKMDNWLFFNMQRHPDHHATAGRRYPLMQHHGGDMSPQVPGGYGKMFALALFPRRWFATMDPLVDQWRAHFYPQIEDWSAYDSQAFAARPEAFEAIEEILGAAPRPASASGSTVPRSCSTTSGKRSLPTWIFPTVSDRTRNSRRSPARASRACTGRTSSGYPG